METEEELLQAIANAVPLEWRRRREELLASGRPLIGADRDEFLRLTDDIESAEAERIKLIGTLATLRGSDLLTTIRELRLAPYDGQPVHLPQARW